MNCVTWKLFNFFFSTSLRDRTFETLEFYRKHQDDITPVALAFFQAEWDESVREVFHKTLGIYIIYLLNGRKIYVL